MKPTKPLKSKKQAQGIAAIRNAEMGRSGVVGSDVIFQKTGMEKRELKKLVKDGWLKMVYVIGQSGGRQRAYYVNPDLRT